VLAQAVCPTVRLVYILYHHRIPESRHTPDIHVPPSRCVQRCTTTTTMPI